MPLPLDLCVFGASLTDVNPGLTFWTLITFGVVFLVLRWKAWGPILQMVEDREAAIQKSLDAAQKEREEAEALLAQQKQAMVEARHEMAEIIRRNQESVEQARTDLLSRNKKEADELLTTARRQIGEEKAKALLEIRAVAVELAVAAAGKLLQTSMDEPRQRALVEQFLSELPKPPRA